MRRGNNEGSIYKDGRTGKWLSVVSIGYDANGRLKRRQMSADTQAQAIDNLALLRMRYNGVTDYRDITLGMWLDWWLVHVKQAALRPSSFFQYSVAVKKLEGLPVMRRRLVNLSAMDIRSLIDSRHGIVNQNWYLIILKSALESAKAHGLIVNNPAEFLITKKHDRKELVILDAESFSRFYHFLSLRDYYAANACLCVWETGLRREEVYSLRYSDVDFVGCVLSVARAVAKADAYYVGRLKTKAARRTLTLSRYYLRHMKEFALATGGISPRKLIFSRDGKVPNLARESAIVSACAKTCGVPCSFRALRHTHATILLHNGVCLKDVQYRLGHKSATTTLDFYGHYVPVTDQSAEIFDSEKFRIL